VDDYYGDGLKADFGVPVPRRDEAAISEDAVSAVRCGLEMGDALGRLNARWRSAGLPTARLRVGIVTGPAVVGSLGGRRKLKYTSVGDTPNTAARLEAFDRAGFATETDTTVRVLVGEETQRRVADRFELASLGSQALKGKGHATTIFRVLGPRAPATDEPGGGSP
jgi:class 3 adenylate cyclase